MIATEAGRPSAITTPSREQVATGTMSCRKRARPPDDVRCGPAAANDGGGGDGRRRFWSYYAVARGRVPGIYHSREGAEAQVRGGYYRDDGVGGGASAAYRGFDSLGGAEDYMRRENPEVYDSWVETSRRLASGKAAATAAAGVVAGAAEVGDGGDGDDAYVAPAAGLKTVSPEPVHASESRPRVAATAAATASASHFRGADAGFHLGVVHNDDGWRRPDQSSLSAAAFDLDQSGDFPGEGEAQRCLREVPPSIGISVPHGTRDNLRPTGPQPSNTGDVPPAGNGRHDEAVAAAANGGDEVPTTVRFDETQSEAIRQAEGGRNVFVTGVAGTGKSEVTREIIVRLRRMGKSVAVAAPTGIAAVNLSRGCVGGGEDDDEEDGISAQTLHSLAGIMVPETVRDLGTMWNDDNRKNWRSMGVLVLDEVGMLGAELLDWMDVYVRKIRGNPDQVFGGVQLIFIGDFAQLPPVPGRIRLKEDIPADPKDTGADIPFGIRECCAMAFQTVAWREAKFCCVQLKTIHRQRDEEFIQALMDVREAKLNSSSLESLVQECNVPLDARPELRVPEGIEPTVLYATNRAVDKENWTHLEQLPGPPKPFKAADSVQVDSEVEMYCHAKVSRDLWSNDFFTRDCQAASMIHLKIGAQVMLLVNIKEDAFDGSQKLVNGSRGVITHFHQHLDFPIVRFFNGREKLIEPRQFVREVYNKGKCIRIQVPLKLAYALTIHKSQGATLECVKVDIGKCFSEGQAYVALSRAMNTLGLQIVNFSPSAIKASSMVRRFYRALENDTMDSFLEEEASLWWLPILREKRWLDLFRNAKGNTNASSQFRAWEAKYSPYKDRYIVPDLAEHQMKDVEYSHRALVLDSSGPQFEYANNVYLATTECDCGRPETLTGGSHVCRYFGTFRCLDCDNHWTSAYCWKGEMQACRGCKEEYLPVKRVQLARKPSGSRNGRHDSSRCSMCRKLGRDCSR